MSRFSDDTDDTPPTRLVRNKAATGAPQQAAPTPAGADLDATRKFDFEPMGGVHPGSAAPTPAANPVMPASPVAPAALAASNGTAASNGSASTGQKTVVFRPSAEGRSKKHSDQPTTGWLVIIAGPGRGASIEISYGLSKIGRDASQDIALDFGDESISRIHHAAIEYDPKLRQFFLSKGENLVYHNGSRVGAGAECELKTGDQIEIGATRLQFVAFCGPEFDWNTP